MKTRHLLPLLALVTVPFAAARADIFGFSTGTYTLNTGQTAVAGPTIANNVATLTSGDNYQGNSLFYNTRQNINAFNVSFTYRDVGGTPTGASATADGFTFTIQNDSRGLNAVGFNGNTLGWAGGTAPLLSGQTSRNAIGNSVAVGFNVYNGSTTGLGTLGALTLNNTSAALLYSGNPINITLSYNGTTLTETLTDSTNSSLTSTFAYNVNIANLVGGNTAYIGFTGADGASTSTQMISNFTYSVVPEPSTWTAGALGLALCAVALRRQYRPRGTEAGSK